MLGGREAACNAEDLGLIPGSGRSSRGENDNPLQYSCLGNPMDKGAWWVTVQRVTKIGHDLATKQEICTRKPNMARQIEKTRQIPGQLCSSL